MVYIKKVIELGATRIVFTDYVPFPGNPFANRMGYEELPEYISVSDVMPEFENAGSNENESEIIVSKKRTYEAAHGYVGRILLTS